MFCDNRGDVNIHRPGQRRIGLGAELPASHEDDVADWWECCRRRPIQEIAGNGFDAAGFEPFAQAGFGETCNADDTLVGRGIARKPCEGRPHFAADTEHNDVAIDCGKIGS
jgi:hypothetical protein